jgi:hypothetical protein
VAEAGIPGEVDGVEVVDRLRLAIDAELKVALGQTRDGVSVGGDVHRHLHHLHRDDLAMRGEHTRCEKKRATEEDQATVHVNSPISEAG